MNVVRTWDSACKILSPGFLVHTEKDQLSKYIAAAIQLPYFPCPVTKQKKTNSLSMYVCMHAYMIRGPRISMRQNHEVGERKTFRIRRDNHPSKSDWFQGRRRSEFSLPSSWKIFATRINRWYRAGEKWNPNDGTRTESLVEGYDGFSNRI